VRIEIRGVNVEVTDELREAVRSRLSRVSKQVPGVAQIEIELREERNPRITDRYVAKATLPMKGATLRAEEANPEMLHSIHEMAEDIRRQVKRYKEKRRGKDARTRRLLARMRRGQQPAARA
jgi:putative sigma-54 modulation protein